MTPETQRRDYLHAMGIDVWTTRGADAAEVETAASDDDRHSCAELDWESLQKVVSTCHDCSLHQSRTQTVFGVGNHSADLMIVGEAPGAEEDRRGEPFVGRAGHLLDEMLRAVRLSRERVFIANILKCRPPNNRDPQVDESAACRRYLDRQIELVQPKLILAVGRIAAQQLLETEAPLGRLRGQKHYLGDKQIPLVVTYHPAYLLRSPTQKRKSWQDLQTAMDLMEQSKT